MTPGDMVVKECFEAVLGSGRRQQLREGTLQAFRTLIVGSILALCIAPAERFSTGATRTSRSADAGNSGTGTEAYYGRDFGMKCDWKGKTGTDDTRALQAALDAVSGARQSFQPQGGVYIGTVPRLVLPNGTCKVAGGVSHSGGMLNLTSDGWTILYQTSDTATTLQLRNAYQIRIQGLTFLGGASALDIGNTNIDQTVVTIEDSQFVLTRDWAIKIVPNGTADHLSAQIRLRGLRFSDCARGIRTFADETSVTDTWLTWGGPYVRPDTAFFEMGFDQSGAPGLQLERVLMVPNSSVTSQPSVRWIDNYGRVSVVSSRFGGENAGLPIVYNYAKSNAHSPFVGGKILIENSEVWAGAGRPDGGVVVLQTELPGFIAIRGNQGPIGTPLIRNNGIPNLTAYLARLAAPKQVPVIDLGARIPAGRGARENGLYPSELQPFVVDQGAHAANWASVPPVNGPWLVGDLLWNQEPSANDTPAWVLTARDKNSLSWRAFSFEHWRTSPPRTREEMCTGGDYAAGGDFLYVCVERNRWMRTRLGTW